MIFVAGGAAIEMRAHPGDLLIGLRVGELEFDLDVPVELVEALLASQLRTRRAEEPRDET